MVIDAGVSRYFDNSAKSNSALLSFLHAQQLRRLDYLAALTVTPENAGTLLNLAQEFELQELWYGGDRPNIQQFLGIAQSPGRRRQDRSRTCPWPRSPGTSAASWYPPDSFPAISPAGPPAPSSSTCALPGQQDSHHSPGPGRLAPALPGRRLPPRRHLDPPGRQPAPRLPARLSQPGQTAA